MNLINGYGDHPGPDKEVTRAEFAAMLVQAPLNIHREWKNKTFPTFQLVIGLGML